MAHEEQCGRCHHWHRDRETSRDTKPPEGGSCFLRPPNQVDHGSAFPHTLWWQRCPEFKQYEGRRDDKETRDINRHRR